MSNTIAPAISAGQENDQALVPITLNTADSSSSFKSSFKSPPTLKRQRSSEGSHDDTRKQRGRPRVEPKDETAADRRRTQIRLAQRTYRARKESTISFLEDKVAKLESKIENSRIAFQNVYQLALDADAANTNPILFDALSSLAQSISASSEASRQEPRSAGFDDTSTRSPRADSEPSSGNESRHVSPPPSGSRPRSDDKVSLTAPNAGQQLALTSAPSSAALTMPTVPAGWGYEMIYEPAEAIPQAQIAQYGMPMSFPQTSHAAAYGPLQQQQQHQHPQQHDVHNQQMYQHQYQQQQQQPQPPPPPQAQRSSSQQQQHQHTQQSSSQLRKQMRTPPEQIPKELVPVQSLAFNENTFARAFHRRCLEYAFTLLRDPARYQNIINKVFEHSLRHSTQAAIYQRLAIRMGRTTDEDLDANVSYPQPVDVDEEGTWFKPQDLEKYLESRGLTQLHPRAETVECVTVMPVAPQMMWQDPSSGMYGPTAFTQFQRKKLVLNVQTLMTELVRHSRCRGTTPAITLEKVEGAFAKSIISAANC